MMGTRAHLTVSDETGKTVFKFNRRLDGMPEHVIPELLKLINSKRVRLKDPAMGIFWWDYPETLADAVAKYRNRENKCPWRLAIGDEELTAFWYDVSYAEREDDTEPPTIRAWEFDALSPHKKKQILVQRAIG